MAGASAAIAAAIAYLNPFKCKGCKPAKADLPPIKLPVVENTKTAS